MDALIQNDICQCFKKLEDMLKTRERRLIRQVEAIHRQQLSVIQSDVLPSLPLLTLDLSSLQDLEQQILNFGNVELKGNNFAVNDSEPYKVVDYQEAHKDHINFDKFIQNEENIEAQKKRDLCLKTPLKLGLATKKTEPVELDRTINFSEESFDKENLFDDEHYTVKNISVSSEHPKQVQQWLRQILKETETEPAAQDQEHFREITKPELTLET